MRGGDSCRCGVEPILPFETGEGKRWARRISDGQEEKIPADMTYKEWREKQDVGGIDSAKTTRKKLYNRTADEKQLKAYQARIGKQNAPKTLDDFQNIKYNDSDRWTEIKQRYRAYGDHSNAYAESMLENGRHHGKYLEALTLNDKQLKKASESYFSQIETHYEKILNPSKYDVGWEQKTERQKDGLLRKWQKDLTRNAELYEIMRTSLEGRK